jgi:hypothetical protein
VAWGVVDVRVALVCGCRVVVDGAAGGVVVTRPALRVHRSPAEEARRDNVMAALADLVRKYDTHERQGWGHIKLGALAAVVDAYRGEIQ